MNQRLYSATGLLHGIKSHVIKVLSTSVLLFSAATAHAGVAPAGLKEFNKTCPANELCPQIELAYQKCGKQASAPDCHDFVRLFKELLPLYDCQRPFDHSGGENYIVPAVWLCDGRRGGGYPQEFESYAGLLYRLKSVDAKKLFASKEFRDVLDGAVAEEYLDKSLQAEKEMRGEAVKGQTVSCRDFTGAFLAWYVPLALGDSREPASLLAIRQRPDFFSKGLLKSMDEDFAAQAKAQGEIVGMDFDPFLNSQDPAEKYVMGKVVVTSGKCIADIKAVDGKPGVCDVKAELRQVGGKWRFSEFRYQDRTLSEILAALKENRRPFPDQYAEAARQAEKNDPAGFLKLYSLAEEGNSAEWAEVSRDTLCELLYNKTALWVKVFSSVESQRLKRYLENGGLAVLDFPKGVKSPEDFSKEVAAKLKKARLTGKEKELAVYLEARLLKK